jgi:hypothetical protein
VHRPHRVSDIHGVDAQIRGNHGSNCAATRHVATYKEFLMGYLGLFTSWIKRRLLSEVLA